MSSSSMIGSEDSDELRADCRISVIIPAYNSANFIERTLRSIISQTAENFEIIVVDDGSEDDTCAVVNEFFHNNTRKDVHLRLLKGEHAGVSSARNFGLEHSKGEYIMFFDSDDLMEIDCLKKFLSPAKEMQYDAIICGYDTAHENGKLLSGYNDKYTYFQNGMSGKEVIKLYLLRKISICIGGIIYKRALLTSNHMKFTTGSLRGEDTEFNMKVLYLSKKVGCVPESLVKYIQRKGSLSKDIPHIFEPNSAKIRIREFLIANHASDDLIQLIDTKTIPESYQTTLHALRHACVPYSDVCKIANKEEIELLKKYNSSPITNRLMLYMYLHTPKLLFFLTKIQHKVISETD